MRFFPVIACAALLIMAGCNGGPFGAPSSTPVESTDTPTATPDPYVASGDALNASQLLTDHTAALTRMGSATHTQWLRITTMRGEVHNSTVTYRANYTTDRYRFIHTSTRRNMSVSIYSTPNASYSRRTQAGQQHYDYREENRTAAFEPYARGTRLPSTGAGIPLRALIMSGTWTQQGVQSYTLPDSDTVSATRFTLASANESVAAALLGTSRDQVTLQNATGEVFVSSEGLIYAYDITYHLSSKQTGNLTMSFAAEFAELNSTRVAAPTWTTTAIDQATAQAPTPPTANFSTDYNASAETVTITHVSGESIAAANLTIMVGTNTTTPWTTAAPTSATTVSPGESATITARPNQTIRVVWVGGDRPRLLDELPVARPNTTE